MTTVTRINPTPNLPIVKNLSMGSITLNGGAHGYLSKATESVSGYKFVGTLGGIWTHPGNVACSFYGNASNTTVYVHAKNNGTSQFVDSITAVCLYLPN